MEFLVKVRVQAESQDDADAIASEVAQSLEDARDSDELPDGVTFSVGEASAICTPLHDRLIERARNIHAIPSGDRIEVDDDALLSEGDDGAFVQGWLWIEFQKGDRPEPVRAEGA